MCAFLLADEFMFTCPGKLATHVFWRTIKNGMKGIGNIIHMLNEANLFTSSATRKQSLETSQPLPVKKLEAVYKRHSAYKLKI